MVVDGYLRRAAVATSAVAAAICLIAVTASVAVPRSANAQMADASSTDFTPHSLEDVTRGPGFGESEADVLRLYRAFFAREADVDGALFWLASASEGQAITSIADGFAASPEFSATYGDLDDVAFLDTVYRNVLGRAAEEAGRDFWLRELSAGRSRGEVVALIANAAEFEMAVPYPPSPTLSVDQIVRAPQFGAEHAEVLRLYQAFLGRSPDVAGAAFWLGELEDGRSIESIADAFAGSAEFERLLDNASDAAFLERVYENVLGRAADAEGREFWLRELTSGTSQSSVVVAFARSPEFVAANPFQMPGVESLQYECGRDLDLGLPRVLSGAALDRLSEQPSDRTFGEFDLGRPWLKPITFVSVGEATDAIGSPPLPIEPPHLGSRYTPACRPQQVAGPPDGGWLDRSLRRQRGITTATGDTLQCSAVDGITGPTVAVLGVSRATLVDVFVDGEYLTSRNVSPKQPAGWATVAWQFERGIANSNAVFALPVGGGAGDSFSIMVVVDGTEVACGSASRLAELPPIQPSWQCNSMLSGVVPALDIFVPSYLSYEVLRDGQLTGFTRFNFFSSFDTGAQPETTHRYELLLRGDGQPDLIMDCGSVTVPADTIENRIATAETIFFAGPTGPYLYGSVNLIAGDVIVNGPIDIVMTPDSFPDYDVVVVDDERQPIEPDLPQGHPGIAPIQAVYEDLRLALSEGSNVEVDFNERGIPVRWTIDGFGVEFVCFEADTAPPDLRQLTEPWCVGDADFGALVARS